MDDLKNEDIPLKGRFGRLQRFLPFAAFTSVFSFFAIYVFWGCWSTNVTFIAPDDPIIFYTSFTDTFTVWVNNFLKTGKMLPTDILWSGLIGSQLFCRELRYVAAIYFAALGMAYFLRAHGLKALSSYGAGLLLAFSGYWFTLFSAGHAGWFVWMSYGVFVFGFIERALTEGRLRHWLLLGLFAAWGSFQQADLWFIFTAFSGVYFISRAIQLRVPLKGFLRGSLLASLVFFFVGAPGFRYALTTDLKGRDKQISESKGTALSGGESIEDSQARWIFITNWSLPPNESSEFFCSRINGDTSCPFVLSINASKGIKPYTGAIGRPHMAKEGNYRQHSIYVGYVTCLLALIAVLSLFKARNPIVLFFTCAAVVFWLFSLGRYCEVFYRLVFALPFGDYLRAPIKWHHLTEFCLCVLAGFGIGRLISLLESFMRGNANVARYMKYAVALLILVGVGNLAFEAKRFCAPVDYSKAIKGQCSSQLAVISRQQFMNPQVSEMVRNGQIISVANWLGNPEAFLVQVLNPIKPPTPPKTDPIALAVGVISLLCAVATVAFACCKKSSEIFLFKKDS